ncbi:penicillin-binding protein 1A [Desulfonatronum thiosulfatophilum]|uniref:Penicillin-binding protein 1A n=1 Tax=Desulfonatronum thiosulfatophilum TaxID=617002 RepID=A0A1G6A1L4_9BACT|nr:PBP1A family penicillin-binding protein [Desulfonatronum thiosulfatophilum]SDB02230.1 penicillin-binding protein 1A [Desulfonatronum thiosulfatophilum]
MRKKLLVIGSAFVVLLMLTGIGGLFGLYFWAARDLPSFKTITDYNPSLVTTVLAQDGQVLGYFYNERRFLVESTDLPLQVTQSFLAAEDSNFYHHEGIDISGILRSLIRNIQARGIVQGGSTITQQVIKSLLLTPERSYERKLKEAILAYRLEHYLTKDEILTIYLNQIFFGAGAYGIEAAARTYFNKHADELTLAEAALLAGLPKAPSMNNPLRNASGARSRQVYVLDRLFSLGWITAEEHLAALEQPMVFDTGSDPSWRQGAWYLEEVRRELIATFGEEKVYNGGLKVQAAVDLNHQTAAENALRNELVALGKRQGWQGPIRNLAGQDADSFLESQAISPAALLAGDWIRVLVTDVRSDGAYVRFGPYHGWIDVQTMGWARTPDPSKAPEDVPPVRDAQRVLNVGDVVWAALRPDKEENLDDLSLDMDDTDVPAALLGRKWELSLEQEPVAEGALASIDPHTGDVLALVGGYSFHRSHFNRATQAMRQSGSTFKPIVYSAALDNGFTAASILMDAPIVYTDAATLDTWKPENFEGRFHGPTMLRTALVKSRNLVTIRVAQSVGIHKIIDRARELGLHGEFSPDLAVSLGSASVSLVNMCQAFSAFARDGSTVAPRTILSVHTAWGEPLLENEVRTTPAISPQNAYIITEMLQEAVRDGTGRRARALGRPVAGKTGTTNNHHDAWFIGYTPYLLTGVYIGFDQLQPLGRLETGSRAALPAWLAYRQQVEENYPVQNFTPPSGLTMARIDPDSGLIAGPDWKGTSFLLPFISGTQPQQVAVTMIDGANKGPSTEEDLLRQVF